ncbi:trimethylamine methyltransferase family protein [Candidatus Bathyarchaeota archaeon]|nr:trimethylamine methyltransferase family protein [Candidatus Bathyarchaeota archaeon]MBS7617864.1 trimethylamine methyltransferase family protein [Candidatus Bathyarchaeota archaeon]
MKLELLSKEDVESIHEASLKILEEVGVQIPNDEVVKALKNMGCEIDRRTSIVKLPENIVVEMVGKASKSFTIYSRGNRSVTFGDGKFKVLSSGGMMNVVDPLTSERRPATLKDTVNAIKLGDALENIDIVGSLFVPQDVPIQLADIYMYATLIKHTSKPFFAWIYSVQSAEYILKMWTAATGGEYGEKPLSLGFFEPISPLKFSSHSLPVLKLFAEHRIPVCFAPMVMASATGPATLAGTLALENAEILAGIVIAEVLGPGTPILYGGIPHILDQRTGNISFGSPEQGLMAVAMVQIGRYYDLPVHVNVGLTDSKSVDFQSGAEKAATMTLGAFAGAELSGHQGIIGADIGGSLEQLVADDEIAGYIKRLLKGVNVEDETIALEVIRRVGVGGNFLSQRHTMMHIRGEFWLPKIFNRLNWEVWKSKGAPAKLEEIRETVSRILSKHEVEPLDPSVEREIDRIVGEASESLIR